MIPFRTSAREVFGLVVAPANLLFELVHFFPNEGADDHFSERFFISCREWLCYVNQTTAIFSDGANDGGAVLSFISRYVDVMLNSIAAETVRTAISKHTTI